MNYVWNYCSKEILNMPSRSRANFQDIRDEDFWRFYDQCSPFSMVHITGFLNTYSALRYINANNIAGDLVECGCHMGGMGIFMALTARNIGLQRRIILFDTFSGFPVGQEDAVYTDANVIPGVQYPSFLEDVRQNIESVLGPQHGIDLVEGDVEKTLPICDVEHVAMLRLDTDFYASTKAEFEHLYPRLSRGGVFTVDDYGIFQGSRRATDEYLAALPNPPLLQRVDTSVWSGLKP